MQRNRAPQRESQEASTASKELAPLVSDLPAEHTSFIGRRSDLAKTRRLLQESPLVTLLGAAGVGKTRLAVRVAKSLRRTFKDGIYFIDLANTLESNQVTDAVTSAMGVRVLRESAETSIAAYLARRDVLVVLDNCEHVTEGVASLVAFLLAKCPTVKLLCTSREMLRIVGERVCFIDPLPLPGLDEFTSTAAPSVELFLDRVSDWIDRDSLDAQDMAHIEAICRGVDGIPLAVELAASRTRVLSVQQLAERIKEPLNAVSRGPRGAERSQTLRSAIEWSYDLCTPLQQQAWSRMAIFGGMIDLDATARIMESSEHDEAATLRLIESLVEKSIISRVEFGKRVWYKMLETLRHFGLEQLSAQEQLDARREHRDWYIERLRRATAIWMGPDQPALLSYFLHEQPNIRAALEFSLSTPGEAEHALGLLTSGWRIVWEAHGRLDELLSWLKRALDQTTNPTAARSSALTLYGVLVGQRGDTTTAHEMFALSREIADHLKDDILYSYIDGATAAIMPDSDESVELYRHALAAQAGNPSAEADAGFKVRLALALDRLGRHEESVAIRSEIIQFAERTGERYECSSLLLAAGAIAIRRGDAFAARALTRHALLLQRELGNAMGMAQAIQTLAGVAILEGDFARGAVLLGAAQPLWRKSGTLPTAVPHFYEDARRFEALARSQLSA